MDLFLAFGLFVLESGLVGLDCELKLCCFVLGLLVGEEQVIVLGLVRDDFVFNQFFHAFLVEVHADNLLVKIVLLLLDLLCLLDCLLHLLLGFLLGLVILPESLLVFEEFRV